MVNDTQRDTRESLPYPKDCLALLAPMEGNPWSEAQSQRYTLALDRMDEDLGRAAVSALCQGKWRSSPEEILQAAARRISPIPSADTAYLEMVWKAENVGLFGRTNPRRPTVFLEGPPPFSHPLVARAVQVCGGWRAICTGEAQFQEGLSKQFRGAYDRLSREWVQSVVNILHLPECERPAALLPRWKPFELPTGWQEPSLHPALPPSPEEPLRLVALEDLPASMRRQIFEIGRDFPAPPDEPDYEP